MKYFKKIAGILGILLFIIYVVMVVRINLKFRPAQERFYTSSNPANLDGLEITPLNYKVYTVEEYSQISSEYKSLSEETARNSVIPVMTMKLKNTSNMSINYTPYFILVIDELNAVNGVFPIDTRDLKVVLAPNEEKEIKVKAYLGPAQLKSSKFSKIDKSTVTLVFDFYPYREMIVFDKAA